MTIFANIHIHWSGLLRMRLDLLMPKCYDRKGNAIITVNGVPDGAAVFCLVVYNHLYIVTNGQKATFADLSYPYYNLLFIITLLNVMETFTMRVVPKHCLKSDRYPTSVTGFLYILVIKGNTRISMLLKILSGSQLIALTVKTVSE